MGAVTRAASTTLSSSDSTAGEKSAASATLRSLRGAANTGPRVLSRIGRSKLVNAGSVNIFGQNITGTYLLGVSAIFTA